MDECKPLNSGGMVGVTLLPVETVEVEPRGLHSFTFQLNVSAFCGIKGSFRGSSGGGLKVLGGIMGCVGCILCQKRLRLS